MKHLVPLPLLMVTALIPVAESQTQNVFFGQPSVGLPYQPPLDFYQPPPPTYYQYQPPLAPTYYQPLPRTSRYDLNTYEGMMDFAKSLTPAYKPPPRLSPSDDLRRMILGTDCHKYNRACALELLSTGGY